MKWRKWSENDTETIKLLQRMHMDLSEVLVIDKDNQFYVGKLWQDQNDQWDLISLEALLVLEEKDIRYWIPISEIPRPGDEEHCCGQ